MISALSTSASVYVSEILPEIENIGGSIANEGQMNPTKWDYSAGRTWGFMVGGAIAGGVSGALGASVAASGMPFANTCGIVASSFTNSTLTCLYTGGQTSVSVNFGIGSYDFTNNSFGFIGKKGNSTLENVGYTFGALANVSDVLIGINPQKIDIVTEHSDAVGHSAILEYGTQTGTTNSGTMKDPNALISVGPNPKANGSWHWGKGFNSWYSHSNKTDKIWRQTLYVNKNTIQKYGNWLNKLELNDKLVYSVELSSCVTHTSAALNLSGIFNIGLHPYLLNAQMYLWSNGVRPWSYCFQLK